MNTFVKSLTAVAVASTLLISVPAQAFSISFGGTNAYQDDIDVDGIQSIAAGLTSSITGINAATNTVAAKSNVYLETFDPVRYKWIDPANHTIGVTPDSTGTLNQFGLPYRPTSGDPNAAKIEFSGSGGGFATANANAYTGTPAGGDLTITGSMGIRRGSIGYAAAPGGPAVGGAACTVAPCDNTYFAYGPSSTDGVSDTDPAKVRIDYTSLLSEYGPGYAIDYLGVFYGSIDTYNGINFYNKAGQLIHGTDALSDGVLTGGEILAAMHGNSGNQTQPNSNVYLNLAFLPNEQFTSFEFYTTGVAVELDNVAVRISSVPEPASLLLVSLGLFGIAGMRRKV